MKNDMQNLPENVPPQPLPVLVQCLDGCWVQYRVELKRTRSEFVEEHVHDLRIALRRLIVAIEMCRAVLHQKKMKKSRRLLKAHLDAFDALRDMQVQLLIVAEVQAELPEIAAYRDRLRKRERQQVLRLEKRIKNFSSAGLAQRVARLGRALLDQNTTEAQAAVWSEADEAYASVVQKRLAIRSEDAASIHRMRLAFKEFRYRVESIQPLLRGVPEDWLRRLHNYQSVMGEIQDSEIGLQMLDKFIAKNGLALSAVRARFSAMREARIATFIAQIDSLETFWRSAPDRKFPWES